MGVDWRPVHRLIATAARPGGVSAAVAEARDVPNEDLVRAERVAVGQRTGGRVIHLPSVVCTSSPSTQPA